MAKADPKKRQEWLVLLARFEASEQKIAQFCADEGVSVPSFYQWRRKLNGGSAKSSGSPKKFQRLHVQGGAAITARLPNGIVLELSSAPAVDKCLDRLFSSDGEQRC